MKLKKAGKWIFWMSVVLLAVIAWIGGNYFPESGALAFLWVLDFFAGIVGIILFFIGKAREKDRFADGSISKRKKELQPKKFKKAGLLILLLNPVLLVVLGIVLDPVFKKFEAAIEILLIGFVLLGIFGVSLLFVGIEQAKMQAVSRKTEEDAEEASDSNRKIQASDGKFYSEEAIRRFIFETKDIYSKAENSLKRDTDRGEKPTFSVIFPDAVEDVLQYSALDDKKRKPAYCKLFSVPEGDGYTVAYVVVDLTCGKLFVESSGPISQEFFTTGESMYTPISYNKLHTLAQIYQNQYINMNESNWKSFVSESEWKQLLPCETTERIFDESVAEDCKIGIDRLFIGLRQRYGSTYCYLRRTTTGYRLYYGDFDRDFFEFRFFSAVYEEDSEQLMNNIFLYQTEGPNTRFNTHAREELDIRLNKDEFTAIYETAPDLFDGNFKGEVREKQIPLSVYGDDEIIATIWKEEEAISCADYPNIVELEQIMCKIGHDAYYGEKFEREANRKSTGFGTGTDKTSASNRNFRESDEKNVFEQASDRFSDCGDFVSKQLKEDIIKMGISAGFLNKPDTFPDRFGYDENKDEYFVEISKEKSNDRLTVFSAKNSEEFRWYILKWLAEGWGQYCELRNRDELGQKWEKAADKPVDGGRMFRTNPAVYDPREESREIAFKALAKVYDIKSEKMQKYMEGCISYLRKL